MLNGEAVAPNSDFGVGANFFTFVPMVKLFDGQVGRFRVKQPAGLFHNSKVYNNISFNDRTIINEGIPEKRIAGITGVPTLSYTIQASASVTEPGERGEQVPLKKGRTLAVSRPVFNGNAPAELNNGIKPTAQLGEPESYHSMSQALQVKSEVPQPQMESKASVRTYSFWIMPPGEAPVIHSPAFSSPKYKERLPHIVAQSPENQEFDPPVQH